MSLSPDQKLAAYLLGRRIAGQRRKQDRVPVAYLYNGVRLPGLPEEWNPVTHPFALVVDGNWSIAFGSQSVWFYAFSTPHHKNAYREADGLYHFAILAGESYLEAKITTTIKNEFDGLSFHPEVKTKESMAYFAKNATWANYEVQNADGTVYLAASDPIPVYE